MILQAVNAAGKPLAPPIPLDRRRRRLTQVIGRHVDRTRPFMIAVQRARDPLQPIGEAWVTICAAGGDGYSAGLYGLDDFGYGAFLHCACRIDGPLADAEHLGRVHRPDGCIWRLRHIKAQICAVLRSPTASVTQVSQLARNHGSLALAQVPPVQVEAEHERERIIAVERDGMRLDSGILAGTVTIPAIKVPPTHHDSPRWYRKPDPEAMAGPT